MSLFDDHIQESDSILEEWYDFSQSYYSYYSLVWTPPHRRRENYLGVENSPWGEVDDYDWVRKNIVWFDHEYKYDASEDDRYMIPKRTAPKSVKDGGYYVTAEGAYADWRQSRPHLMAEEYHISFLSHVRIDKKHYLRELNKAREREEIKVHYYKGKYYYNSYDLQGFYKLYEIDLILKICKKHKFHWVESPK